MAAIRLDSEERRRGIVEAALPLFARKGFTRTTTKEIAEAARVSEALVYKHFPSKAALYEEIVRLGCQADPALERIAQLEASTTTLINMVQFMVRHFVMSACAGPSPRSETGGEGSDMATRMRLMVNSFLEDGEYARLAFEWVFGFVYPKIAECLAAAERAGDLVALPIAIENRFWFAQHVAAMMNFVRLPGRCAVPYAGDTEALIREAAWFILRGLGVKDEVIAAHRPPAGNGGANRASSPAALPIAALEITAAESRATEGHGG
jgi:TetR/AcrR family transcriptional regulator, transcriptional repressor of aconitase